MTATREDIISELRQRGHKVTDLSSEDNTCLEIETHYSFWRDGWGTNGWMVRLQSTPSMYPKTSYEVFAVEWNKDDVKFHMGVYHKLIPEWHTAESVVSWMEAIRMMVNKNITR
jgi:hypothetical protein